MSKTLYLIIILSVVLFKSENSFGQDLKKELGICGKTMSALLVTAPKKDPELSASSVNDEEFCDNGRYELNANFVIYLYDAKDKVVYDKHVYLSTLNYQERTNGKGTFIKSKVAEGPSSRIVKFPISKTMGQVTSYKIKSLKTNKMNEKITELKKIQW